VQNIDASNSDQSADPAQAGDEGMPVMQKTGDRFLCRLIGSVSAAAGKESSSVPLVILHDHHDHRERP
jgi:hypothetical protein